MMQLTRTAKESCSRLITVTLGVGNERTAFITLAKAWLMWNSSSMIILVSAPIFALESNSY
jgi:hypothetical protein